MFAFSQTDTILRLPEINVSASRIVSPDELGRLEKLDTLTSLLLVRHSLSDQLNAEAGSFIKTYGPGSLATISQRGMGASHTAIIWNGLQINSPMLGQTDLSLMPSFLTDQVTVQYGGNGSMLGSGAVSGAVFLDTKLDTSKGVSGKIMTSAGSFSNFQEGIRLNYNGSNFQSSIRYYRQTAKNDFPFINNDGVSKNQENASLLQNGVSSDFNWNKKNDLLAIHLWYFESYRGIPPTLVTINNTQQQNDKAIRSTLEWTHLYKKIILKCRSGISHEELQFKDQLTVLDDRSKSNNLQSESELKYQLTGNTDITVHANWIHSEATASGYQDGKSTDQFNALISILYQIKSDQLRLSLRKGIYQGNAIPFQPSITYVHFIAKDVSINIQANTVYRLPTLNDLYWSPGGNKNLLPEEGYTTSAGIKAKKQIMNWESNCELFFYASELKQMLVWLPSENGIYNAYNIQKVRSYGVEANINVNYKYEKSKFTIAIAPQLNSSKILETTTRLTASQNKKQIYIPSELIKGAITFERNNWLIKYTSNYTGMQYTDAENTRYLDAFTTADFLLSTKINLKQFQCTATLTVRNCWDEKYQVIAWRPMPGRNYEVGIVIGF